MVIVSIEGLDGVGKSSLATGLAADNFTPLSEPGGTAVGEVIRSWVKGHQLPQRSVQHLVPAAQEVIAAINPKIFPDFQPLINALFFAPAAELPSASDLDLSPLEEAALFNIARAELLATIEPGQRIVFDRFVDSTVAYQGYGSKWPIVPIIEINELATADRYPQVTFYLQLDEKKRRQRLGQRGEQTDRIEARDSQFFIRAADGFADLARSAPERIITLDASASPQELLRQAREHLAARGLS